MSVYKCPKCGGSSFFMSTRIADEYGVHKVPVCRTCDEIMDLYKTNSERKKTLWINIVGYTSVTLGSLIGVVWFFSVYLGW